EIVLDVLALTVGGRFRIQHQLGFDRGGNIILIMRVTREIELSCQQLVPGCMNFKVQVGWTPGVPPCGCDKLTASTVGWNLVRRWTDRVDVEATVVTDSPDAAQVPLRDTRRKL